MPDKNAAHLSYLKALEMLENLKKYSVDENNLEEIITEFEQLNNNDDSQKLNEIKININEL